MESVALNVSDLSSDQRHAFEGVLGQPLSDRQRVVVQVVDTGIKATDVETPTASNGKVPELPDWVTIFADLSDEEFADLQSVILQRADLSRTFEVDE